jgi:hypothetical protein
MTNETLNKITEEINAAIGIAYIEYKMNGKSVYYNRKMSEINGMIKVLEMVTGKRYGFDEVNGLFEQ